MCVDCLLRGRCAILLIVLDNLICAKGQGGTLVFYVKNIPSANPGTELPTDVSLRNIQYHHTFPHVSKIKCAVITACSCVYYWGLFGVFMQHCPYLIWYHQFELHIASGGQDQSITPNEVRASQASSTKCCRSTVFAEVGKTFAVC